MDAPYCLECRWLDMRLGPDRKTSFICRKNRIEPGEALLWKRSCERFEPMETS